MTAPCCLDCGGPVGLRLGGVTDTRFGVPGTFEIARCRDCALEQTQPRPAPDALQALYARHYNFGGSRASSPYVRLRERLMTWRLYRWWLAVDGDISFHTVQAGTAAAAPRLLDVGCNEGRGLVRYRRNGFAAEGLEPNPVAAAQARARGFVVHGADIADFRPAGVYDVVVLSNVLEHALDPADMLGHVHRILRPGGALWISCPNADSVLRRLFGRAWINWHVPFHIVHFTNATLTRMLRTNGFQVVREAQATPALWVAQSMIAAIVRTDEDRRRALRDPILISMLMVIVRGLLFPDLWLANRLGRGDCLVVRAARA